MGCTAWRDQIYNHEPRHAPPGRHALFVLYFRNIFDYPLPLIVADGNRLEFGMIEPNGLVLPTRRKLECVASFGYRNGFLEEPVILENVVAVFVFDFIADDIAGFGSGD